MASSALEEDKATVYYLVHTVTTQMELPASAITGLLQGQPTPRIIVFLKKLVVPHPLRPAQAA